MARMTSEGVLTVSNPRVISKPLSEFPCTPEGDEELRAEIARMRGVQDLDASTPRAKRGTTAGITKSPTKKGVSTPTTVSVDDL